MMAQILSLYIPQFHELWYRRQMMEDPATMDYNRGYDLSIPGYHPDTGCIDFPESAWKEWFDRWIHREPEKFYAYIVRKSDGEWLGEVCLHRRGGENAYEIGIVLEGKYRCMGYASIALELLLQHAFCQMQAEAVYNRFESSRKAALRIHRSAGFVPMRTENGIPLLCLSKERYFALHGEENA